MSKVCLCYEAILDFRTTTLERIGASERTRKMKDTITSDVILILCFIWLRSLGLFDGIMKCPVVKR
jgi:hypothetical protein